MSGPAFRHALRQTLAGALMAAFGFGVFIWVIMVSSSGFAGDSARLPVFLLKPPRAVRALVGGTFDFRAASGWIATGMFHPVVLSLQTLGAFLVATATGAAELERGTLDLVLSRPVGRRAYLAARGYAMLVVISIVELGGFAGALVSRETVRGAGTVPLGDLLLVFADSWLLFAAFGMVALAIASSAHLRGRATGAAIGIVIGAFFINFVSLVFDQTSWMRFLTPFNYYSAREILNHEAWAWEASVLAGLAIACGAFALHRFSTRDLTR